MFFLVVDLCTIVTHKCYNLIDQSSAGTVGYGTVVSSNVHFHCCSAPYTFTYDACKTVPCGGNPDKCSGEGGCLVSESFSLSGLSGTPCPE